jgi:hypothetical protein
MNIIWEETISFHPKALAVSEKGILLAFYGNPGGPGDYTGFSTLAVTGQLAAGGVLANDVPPDVRPAP